MWREVLVTMFALHDWWFAYVFFQKSNRRLVHQILSGLNFLTSQTKTFITAYVVDPMHPVAKGMSEYSLAIVAVFGVRRLAFFRQFITFWTFAI